MTQEELRQVAEESWEGCDGCTLEDKAFWISGFVRAANLFSDVDGLPSPDQLEERGMVMAGMFTRLVSNQRDLDPEFNQIISDNFNELI